MLWLTLAALAAIALATTPGGVEERPFAESSEEEPEPNNQYLTKKDFKNIALGIAFVGALLFPVYMVLKGNSDQYNCLQNMKAISTAMLGYASNYDDRLPPTYARAQDSSLPRLDEKGRPFTWASTLVNLAGFDRRRNFVCPSAPGDAKMVAEGLDNADLPMTYGMYAGLDVANTRDIDDPGFAVLVTETSNGGSENSYDPHPITVNGKVIDSFLIGWADGDTNPPTDPKKVGNVTRLAFKNSKNGLKAGLAEGRHDVYLDVLFADGHARALKSNDLANPKHWPVVTRP
jgi:prepilin-type processing-associated H-X9-DG protein